MNFDMNTAWSQAISLVRSNFQLLALVAGVFLLVPSLLMYIAIPGLADLANYADNPDAMLAMMQEMLIPILTYGLISFVVQLVGYVAMIALMGGERPTVGEAIANGIKALPTLIGAFLIYSLGYFVLSLVSTLLVLALGAILGEAVAVLLVVLMTIAQLAAIFYVACRLCLTIPIIVHEKKMNPFTVFKRSWALTKNFGRRIVGFFLLLFIAYIVVSLLVSSVLGLVLAMVGTGPALLITGIITGVFGAAAAMMISGILVSIYAQLSGGMPNEVSNTFE